MKKTVSLAALLLLPLGSLLAQLGSSSYLVTVTAAPTGACTIGASAQQVAGSGAIWYCAGSTIGASGTWTLYASSSGIIGTSNVTGQATSQSAVTLGSSLAAGLYSIKYYADQNAAGSGCTVSFTFNWTDVSNSRTLTTGNLTLSGASSSAYLSGMIPVWAAASSSITYTSTVAGSCGSGAYDIHASLAAN